MSKKKKPNNKSNHPKQINDSEKSLSKRNLIISIIVGVLAIFSFAIELPKKVSETINVFSIKTPTPVIPLAFPTAHQNEALIIVTDFQNLSEGAYKGIDPAQYIYEQLLSQVNKDNLSIRVERIKYSADNDSASRIGEIFNATLVIWGEYDSISIKPMIEKVKKQGGIKAETHRFSLADTTRISSIILYDMPSEVTYLTFLTLGLEKYSSGNFSDALEYTNSAINVDSTRKIDKSDAFFYRANIHFMQDELSLAIDDYTEAIRLRPEFSEAFGNRAVVYGSLATTENPPSDSNPQCIFWYPSFSASYSAPNSTITGYEISVSSQGLLPSDQLRAFYTDGTYSNLALSDISQSIKLNGNIAQSHYNKGVLLTNLCKYDEAIAAFQDSLNIDPYFTYAFNNMGNLYVRQQKYQEAISEYSKAIEISPNVSAIYINRGMVYETIKDYNLAIENYTNSIIISPNLLEGYYLRGSLLSDLGRCPEALNDYNFLVSKDPNQSSYYSSRGYCLFYTIQVNLNCLTGTPAL